MSEEYIIRWSKETAWAVLFGVAAAVGPMLGELDWDEVALWGVEDWRSYLYVLGAASLRVAGAITLNAVRKLLGVGNSVSNSPGA